MVEFRTSSAFRGWVRVRVMGYGFGVRGRKVKSRECALASDLVRATIQFRACRLITYCPARIARQVRASHQPNRPSNQVLPDVTAHFCI